MQLKPLLRQPWNPEAIALGSRVAYLRGPRALAYGVATTVASYFFVFPSMGFGVFGRRSPEGIRAPLSALANHLFYGVGLAIGVVLV